MTPLRLEPAAPRSQAKHSTTKPLHVRHAFYPMRAISHIVSPIVTDYYDTTTQRKARKHQCTYCEKRFMSRTDLARHTRVHTGEKPYECHVCGKRFNVEYNMKMHLFVHQQTDSVNNAMKSLLNHK